MASVLGRFAIPSSGGLCFYNFVFLSLFWAVLGLHCCSVFMGFSLPAVSRGYSLVAVHWLLTAVASLVVEHRL